MMKTIRTITLAALMLAALPAKSPAQTLPQDTTLNRTVVVEQEYTPDIRDAAKVNAVPAVEAPVVQPKAVEYDNRLQPLADIPAGNMPAYTGRQALPKATPATCAWATATTATSTSAPTTCSASPRKTAST